MEFKEKITIKESYISVDENIYTNSNDLTKYLLFGENITNKEYIVQQGDTIEKIAETPLPDQHLTGYCRKIRA